jgi:hypothetical protein
MSVICVADAADALASKHWPGKSLPEYRETVRIVDEAISGYCTPANAIEAFNRLAAAAGILIRTPPKK